jgi:uncharacterized protein GlcG (DUF336 family)
MPRLVFEILTRRQSDDLGEPVFGGFETGDVDRQPEFVIPAIRVSGGTAQQDGQIAKVGADTAAAFLNQ